MPPRTSRDVNPGGATEYENNLNKSGDVQVPPRTSRDVNPGGATEYENNLNKSRGTLKSPHELLGMSIRAGQPSH